MPTLTGLVNAPEIHLKLLKRPLKAMRRRDPRRAFSQDICYRDVSRSLSADTTVRLVLRSHGPQTERIRRGLHSDVGPCDKALTGASGSVLLHDLVERLYICIEAQRRRSAAYKNVHDTLYASANLENLSLTSIV
jgi:hypothetical protein